MYTGESDIQNIGQISEWNFLPNINESIYPKPCGDLTGSAGEFFPPGRDDTYVDFFSPDLCRQVIPRLYPHCVESKNFTLI